QWGHPHGRYGRRALPGRCHGAGAPGPAARRRGVRRVRRGVPAAGRCRGAGCHRAAGHSQAALPPRPGVRSVCRNWLPRALRFVRVDAAERGAACARGQELPARGDPGPGSGAGDGAAARRGLGEGVRRRHHARGSPARDTRRGTGMTVRFRYRAATPEGNVVEGLVQAPSRQSVLEELRRQHLYPVAVDEAAAADAARAGRRLGRRAAVALWTRNAGTLLGAGVPLDRALAFTAQHAGHDGLAEAVRQVRRAVQAGTSLADALAQHPRYFDPLFVAMVAAGEASGALEIVFERLSEHLEEGAELRSQVRSALLYPALMAVVASVGVVVLLGFVIPRFASILADVGSTRPFSTRLLLGASHLLTWCRRAWIGRPPPSPREARSPRRSRGRCRPSRSR